MSNTIINKLLMSLHEKADLNKVEKEVNDALKGLSQADTALNNISSILQQSGDFDIRKDVIGFIGAINDIDEYLSVDLLSKLNPPEEKEKE